MAGEPTRPENLTVGQSSVQVARRIFAPESPHNAMPQWQVGAHWVDLYAILEVREDASPSVIEEAIVGRGAECLCLAFARSGQAEIVRLIDRHLHQFRPILLDADCRQRYDALLRSHRRGESGAATYEEFVAEVGARSPASAPSCITHLFRRLFSLYTDKSA